jgi:branched-chain amino acid transport system ATP-binding protein
MLLQLSNLTVRYNKVTAVSELDLGVGEGDAVTIIGANGAGKTTTLRAVSGLVQPAEGTITFDGARIDGLAADRIVARGIAHVPEGRRIFKDMTVYENLMTGAFLRRQGEAIRQDLEQVYAHFPRLAERRTQWAKTLSGGEQQMLAIGRALMSRPRLLLLDEPSMGLAPMLVQEIARVLGALRADGLSILIVEQNAELALSLARYAYVLENGCLSMDAPAAELHENEHVKSAYLGA